VKRRVVIGILFLLIASLQVRLWTGEDSYAHVVELERKVESQQMTNASRLERNRIFERDIRALKRDNALIEEKARSELGLIKEGETFYLLIDRQD
jgi:cell division protein FtsB